MSSWNRRSSALTPKFKYISSSTFSELAVLDLVLTDFSVQVLYIHNYTNFETRIWVSLFVNVTPLQGLSLVVCFHQTLPAQSFSLSRNPPPLTLGCIIQTRLQAKRTAALGMIMRLGLHYIS